MQNLFRQQSGQQRKPLNAKEKSVMIEKEGYDNLMQLAEEKSWIKKDNAFCGCALAADGDEQEQNTTAEVTDEKPNYLLPIMIGFAAVLSLYAGYLRLRKK